VFDSFLLKYGSDYDLTERVTRVLRHGLTLFGSSALPIAPMVVGRMSQGFVATGFSSYLWVAGKIVGQVDSEEDQALRASFQELLGLSTSKVVSILQAKSPGDVPDVLEDYIQMLLQILDHNPDIFFQNPAFENTFTVSMAALDLVHTDIVFAALDLFRSILTHDCLEANPSTAPPKFAMYAATIRPVVSKVGEAFVGYLLNGLLGHFPEESTPLVISIMRSLAMSWPTQLQSWLPPVLQQLPTSKVPIEEKSRFLNDIINAINSRRYEKVKYAMNGLNRAAMKTRDRRQGLQGA